MTKLSETHFRPGKMFSLLQRKAEIMSHLGPAQENFPLIAGAITGTKCKGFLVAVCFNYGIRTHPGAFWALHHPALMSGSVGWRQVYTEPLDRGDSEGRRCLFTQRHLRSLYNSLKSFAMSQPYPYPSSYMPPLAAP